VERQAGRWQIQGFAERTRRQAFLACHDQGTENAQAAGLGQRSERLDNGFFFHNSIFIE
jgi:hypothetical protein